MGERQLPQGEANLPMGKFYRETSIVSYRMIEQINILILTYEGHGKAPGKAVKNVAETAMVGLPVVLRQGAVDIKLGKIHRIRKGRDEMFADLILNLEGHLEFEPVKDEDGAITEIKPIKFVYQKEKRG